MKEKKDKLMKDILPEEKSADNLEWFMQFMAGNQEKALTDFAGHFGHLDETTQLNLIAVTRMAILREPDSMPQLISFLVGKMLIVPPTSNTADITKQQIRILTDAYIYNRDHWDKLLRARGQ